MQPARLDRNLRSGLRALIGLFALVAFGAAAPLLAENSRTEHLVVDPYGIEIWYAPGHEKVARKVAEICEESIPELAAGVGLERVESFRIHLVESIRVIEAEVGMNLPSWGIAFAFVDSRVMVVDVRRATSAWNSLERVVPHELSHLLAGQRIEGVQVPTWFLEGMAMWQAREWSLLENWRLMDAVWTKRAPRLEGLIRGIPGEEKTARDAYRISYAGFTYLFDKRMEDLPDFLGHVAHTGDFSRAFDSYWGEGQGAFYARFGEHITRKYSSRLLLFQPGPLFSIIAVLFLFVFLKIRWRNRRKLKHMERVEQGLTSDDW